MAGIRAKIRMGMVGGGPSAFIGPVHRIAAELDGHIVLVAGAFSSSAERSREAGAQYRIDAARAYPDLNAMLANETRRDDGIDFLSIVTPNHMHLPAAIAALNVRVPVMSDKPATATLDEALELRGVGHALCADLYLFRLSAGARSASAHHRRGNWQGSQGRGGISAGLAGRRSERQAGRMAGRSGTFGLGRMHRRHRRPRLSSGGVRHRPDRHGIAGGSGRCGAGARTGR